MKEREIIRSKRRRERWVEIEGEKSREREIMGRKRGRERWVERERERIVERGR